MHYSRHMVQTASRAASYLEDGTDLVGAFIQSLRMPDGGFRGRASGSDLYYTVFAADSLAALGRTVEPESLTSYLDGFGDGAGLDFVHLACLARLRSGLRLSAGDGAVRQRIAERIERNRRADGGYHASRDAAGGSVHGCFLAYTAYQDLGLALPAPERLLDCLDGLRTADGLQVSEPGLGTPSTHGAVGAILLRIDMGRAPEPRLVEWLLAQFNQGGFQATPDALGPDLVSTATALYALSVSGAPLAGVRELCVQFAEHHWDERGGFTAHWLDDTLDAEHTFYGLLALGCLAPATGGGR